MKDKQAWSQHGVLESRLVDVLNQKIWFKFESTGRWRRGTIIGCQEIVAEVRMTDNYRTLVRWEHIYS